MPGQFVTEWRREAMRTNLWLIPSIEVAAAVLLFLGTHLLDSAAYRGALTLPSWVNFGTADSARQILTTLAAAVITVAGIVFSITIVTLTLASTQFGPRMLRNFIRDRGTQLTLGTFVATFVYATLVLISVGSARPGGTFVPHLSITVAVALVTVSMGILIYFIHHIAVSIQLPHVIASIAGDLRNAIDADSKALRSSLESGPSEAELLRRMDEAGGLVLAPSSGYLQYIRHEALVALAAEKGAVIRLLQRPGQFIVKGQPMAAVWPAQTAADVSAALRRAHVAGPTRTLAQDLAFAVDQLVEIALRALSPAVNDTFTALTCIDWLGDGLCKVTRDWRPVYTHRDIHGYVRVLTSHVSYSSLIERAFEKIRQAARGMPAVMIRQLQALARIMEETSREDERRLLLHHGAMILSLSEETVGEAADRADVLRHYDQLVAAAAALTPQAHPAIPHS